MVYVFIAVLNSNKILEINCCSLDIIYGKSMTFIRIYNIFLQQTELNLVNLKFSLKRKYIEISLYFAHLSCPERN